MIWRARAEQVLVLEIAHLNECKFVAADARHREWVTKSLRLFASLHGGSACDAAIIKLS